MRADLVPGGRFPDLELPDHAGNVRRLSGLVGGDPLVLQFYRGWFCPKEREFFQRMVRLQDEAEVAYTRMVSVSTEPSAVQAAFRAGLGARWTFLSDEHRRYQAELDLLETTDEEHRDGRPSESRKRGPPTQVLGRGPSLRRDARAGGPEVPAAHRPAPG